MVKCLSAITLSIAVLKVLANPSLILIDGRILSYDRSGDGYPYNTYIDPVSFISISTLTNKLIPL